MNLPLRNSRISLPQGQIFWREVGQGSTLIFLHGSWSDSSQWLPVIECLSLKHHCLAPDLLGFGESERPNIHYSIQLEVECLAEFLEALNLRQVYLIGHSIGAWVAASYALRYAHQVRGLVLLAPEGVGNEGSGKPKWWIRSLIGRPPVVFWSLRVATFLAKLFRRQEKIRQVLEYRKQLLQFPATSQLLISRRRAEIHAELLQEKLDWLKVPTVILQGEQDTPAAITRSQTYAELSLAAQLKMIPDVGNDLPQQVPDVVAQYIQKFVEG